MPFLLLNMLVVHAPVALVNSVITKKVLLANEVTPCAPRGVSMLDNELVKLVGAASAVYATCTTCCDLAAPMHISSSRTRQVP